MGERPGYRARVPRAVVLVNRATRISAAPHAAFRRLAGAGGGVLLHLKSTAYFEVNEMGATVWELVQDKITFVELVNRVRALVPDPTTGLENDIARFVDDLTSRDLVVVEPIN